jgi:hypothetical protein
MGEFDGLDFEPMTSRELSELTVARLDRIKITLGNWKDSLRLRSDAEAETMRQKLIDEMHKIGTELAYRQDMRELPLKEAKLFQILGIEGIESAEGFGRV